MDEKIRLNKYLSSQGVGSRRKVNDLIKQGRIKVNGEVARLNHKVDPDSDTVLVDDKKITHQKELIYLALNKPKGVISTTSDEFSRQSVIDLIKVESRVYPVGRLDSSTSGLIILTNDGDFTFKLTHPKFGVPKTYELVVTGDWDNQVLDKLEGGVYLKEGVTSPAKVKIISRQGNRITLELTIHQGWNHQIKRMCAVLGLNLVTLKRVAIGNIKLADLKVGEYRYLTKDEVESLLKS